MQYFNQISSFGLAKSFLKYSRVINFWTELANRLKELKTIDKESQKLVLRYSALNNIVQRILSIVQSLLRHFVGFGDLHQIYILFGASHSEGGSWKIHVKKIFPITVWECKMDRFKAVDFKQQQCTMHWWKWLKFQRSKSKDKSNWIGETFFFQCYFSIFCYLTYFSHFAKIYWLKLISSN